jgi:hypothetical protein
MPDLFGTIDLDALAPTGWTLKAVMYRGRDLLDEGLALKGGENISGVEVILSDQVGAITGTVALASGAPAAGCTIALFPDEPITRFNSRRMRLARADQHGAFRVGSLPSGAYRAAASFDIDASAWLTEDSLDRLRAVSTPIALGSRDQASTTLVCAAAP